MMLAHMEGVKLTEVKRLLWLDTCCDDTFYQSTVPALVSLCREGCLRSCRKELLPLTEVMFPRAVEVLCSLEKGMGLPVVSSVVG